MGHGHVTPNPDGSRMRCGGPGVCGVCNAEQAAQRIEQEKNEKIPNKFQTPLSWRHHFLQWWKQFDPGVVPGVMDSIEWSRMRNACEAAFQNGFIFNCDHVSDADQYLPSCLICSAVISSAPKNPCLVQVYADYEVLLKEKEAQIQIMKIEHYDLQKEVDRLENKIIDLEYENKELRSKN